MGSALGKHSMVQSRFAFKHSHPDTQADLHTPEIQAGGSQATQSLKPFRQAPLVPGGAGIEN